MLVNTGAKSCMQRSPPTPPVCWMSCSYTVPSAAEIGMQSGQHLPHMVQRLAAHAAVHTTGSCEATIASNLNPWNVGGSSARSAAVKVPADMFELSSLTTAN